MPRGIPIQPDEIQHILDLFNDCRKKGRSLMESYKLVGAMVERDHKVIANIIQRLKPTTDLARMYFRAKSYKLAKRLVAKASPSEIIDILQRPSVGVLDPIKKVDMGPGGFFLSVNAESCGSVKVGVMQPQPEQKQIESGEEEPTPFNPFADAIDVGQGENHGTDGDAEYRETAQQGSEETVIERVRRQLAQRRGAIGAGD